jgi:hypothetical protein
VIATELGTSEVEYAVRRKIRKESNADHVIVFSHDLMNSSSHLKICRLSCAVVA